MVYENDAIETDEYSLRNITENKMEISYNKVLFISLHFTYERKIGSKS
jgi:hypothetical protein